VAVMTRDRVAWVIGGTSGIGEACVKRLDDFNEDVIASDSDDCDVTDPRAIMNKLSYFQNNKVHVEAIVFSAGVNHLQWLHDMGDGKRNATWYSFGMMNEVVSVNLVGFINIMSALASHPWTGVEARERLGGDPPSVVAVSSDAAVRPMRTSMAYCASKAGLDMAVKCAARELGPRGWRINAVSPGMTADTCMTEYVDDTVPGLRGWTREEAAAYEKSQEVVPGRIDPFDIAEVVVNVLYGPQHLNGAIVTINGGR
jgi:NAD(P)-dependent dehydrogenase (short-subunit alcohol dehydrogenase family)